MKLNKIEIVPTRQGEEGSLPATLQLRYLKDDGKYHRTCVDCTADLSSFPEEVQAAAQVAQTIPETTELARIDFNCGASALRLNDDDTVTEVYDAKYGMVSAKTKDKRIKNSGRALAVLPCFKCPVTKLVKDTDLTAIPNTDLKAAAEAFFKVKKEKYKKDVRASLETSK